MRFKEPEAVVETSVEPVVEERRIKVDEVRKSTYRTICTNIMTRAWSEAEGRVVSCDIVHLDRQSLSHWLDENHERTVRTVLVMLGHPLS